MLNLGIWGFKGTLEEVLIIRNLKTFSNILVRQADDEGGVPQLSHLREGPAAAVEEHQEAR